MSPTAAVIPENTAEAALRRMRESGWRPEASEPRYVDSNQIAACVLVAFSRGSEHFVLVAARTSEVANDRYAYVESLISTVEPAMVLVSQAHYYYDVAGIEGLEWPTLWPVNVALLSVGWLLVSAVKWWRIAQTSATDSR